MQTFRSRFTTDISQHQRTMRLFRNQTCATVQEVRNQLIALGGVSLAGIGIKDAAKDIILLAAEMEKTKVAFNVMLGSAERANAVLGDLVKFADITPFDTAEIIAAGRALMACGTSTDDLSNRLELLGNIAAGTGMKIGDMVAIYAKMANKGRVQTEELNQMAERGIPIYKLLCEMLEINQEELSAMAEKGSLSFRLIQEALEKLGGSGGLYFGLIEKQAETLDGKLSTLQGNIKLLATEFGEMITPELTSYLDTVIKKIDEMKNSGELDQIMRKLADTIIALMRNIVALGKWLAQNKDMLFSTGKIIFYAAAFQTLNSVLTHTGNLLRTIRGTRLDFDSLRRASGTIKYLTTDLRALRRASGGVQTGLKSFAAAAAAVFIGWEIGKRIGELLQLEEIFKHLSLAPGVNEKDVYGKPETTVKTRDLVKDYKDQLELRQKAKKARNDAAVLLKAGNKAGADKKNAEADGIEKKAKEIADASYDYKSRAREAERDMKDAQKDIMNAQKEYKTAIAKKMEAQKNGKDTRELDVEVEVAKGVFETRVKQYQKLKNTRDQFQKQQKALDSVLLAEEAKAAKKSDEAAKWKAKREKENQEKLLEIKRKAKEEQKKIADEKLQMEDEAFRDQTSGVIDRLRKNIKKYEKDIDEVDKKLGKLGLNIDEDILKTPEQILQAKKDDVLKKKIEAQNQGEKVTFSKEEMERINSLRKEQKKARRLKGQKNVDENRIETYEEEQENRDYVTKQRNNKKRQEELDRKNKNILTVEKQLENLKKASQPLETILKSLETILKKGLPGEVV